MKKIIVFRMIICFIESFIFSIFWSYEFNFLSLSSECVSHHSLRLEMEQLVFENRFPTLLTVFLSFSCCAVGVHFQLHESKCCWYIGWSCMFQDTYFFIYWFWWICSTNWGNYNDYGDLLASIVWHVTNYTIVLLSFTTTTIITVVLLLLLYFVCTNF